MKIIAQGFLSMRAAQASLTIFQEEAKGRSGNSADDMGHLGHIVLNENAVNNLLPNVEDNDQDHG